MRLPCADLTMTTVGALDSWVYQSCLVDAANASDSHDDDDLELNFAQESEETVTSIDVNHVCPVCSMTSIPVDGEHVYSSSADLICNLCISD